MKRLVMVLVLAFITIGANAQFYGGFYQADPNAWIDKESYFACRNSCVYNGWGQNIQNISVVINGTDVYSFPYIWEYGKYITIGKANGINFSSGDTVTLYWGNQCIGTWTYKTSSALPDIKIRGGKNAGKILNRAWKYIKKIR